jgi:hypothetical protein
VEEQGIRQLLQDLDEAFGDLPIPPEDEIVYDNSGYHLECNQIRLKFRGRHWRDLPVGVLSGEADSIVFFTPEAFRFYLPAFIRSCLLDPIGADLIPEAILSILTRGEDPAASPERQEERLKAAHDHEIPASVLTSLATGLGEDLGTYRQARLATLTARQKEVVGQFITLLKLHRAGEFSPMDLDRAEEALRQADT